MRVALIILAIILTGCTMGAQSVGLPGLPSSDASLAPHMSGEVLVRIMPGADKRGVAQSVSATIIGEISRLDVVRLRLSDGRPIVDAIRGLKQRPDVLYAEPNYIAAVPEQARPTAEPLGRLPPISLPGGPRLLLTPNDPAFPTKLWGLVKIGAPVAWDTTTGASNVVIAVLDTGVDSGHPDLAAKVLPGSNCVTPPCTPGGSADDNGHGTHVSGTAAALGNNSTGITGVAFNAATQILPIKVVDSAGSGTFAGIAAGIIKAADDINGIGKKGVINMSLGGFGYSQTLQDAIEYATALSGGSILVVASSGNEFKRWATHYPAALMGVMAVGATDGNDAKVNFSNPGPHLSVAAPGQDVYSTLPGSSYAYFSGTSMASPHVAGLAALVWSQNPGFTNYQVRRAIEVSATDLGAAGWDESFGWGRINAASAVTTVPPAFYGCAVITVQTAPSTAQPGADVIMSVGGTRRTSQTNSSGQVRFDFIPFASYAVTASKVISGTGNFGSTTVVVSAPGPTACATATITIAP